jgi:hypothetical protein
VGSGRKRELLTRVRSRMRRSDERAAVSSTIGPREVHPTPRRIEPFSDPGLDSLNEQDLDRLERDVVWIFGSPRTGSTWLTEMLCDPARIELTIPAGFRVDARPAPPVDAIPVNEFLISRHLAPAFGEPIEANGRMLPATLNNYMSHKPAYLFSDAASQTWRPGARRLGLVRLHSTLAAARASAVRLTPRPMLVIKEVNGSYAADLMMSLFPRSRMIFIVRDGRDVIDSLAHALGEGGWLARQQGQAQYTESGRADWLKKAARDWSCDVDAASLAYERHPEELRALVRYEDLMADTEGTMRSLFEAIGLERSPERLAEVVEAHSFANVPAESRGDNKRRRAARPGLWRKNLRTAEQEAVEAIMGDRLERFGYGD